jgi:uncharacterized membrane protein
MSSVASPLSFASAVAEPFVSSALALRSAARRIQEPWTENHISLVVSVAAIGIVSTLGPLPLSGAGLFMVGFLYGAELMIQSLGRPQEEDGLAYMMIYLSSLVTILSLVLRMTVPTTGALRQTLLLSLTEGIFLAFATISMRTSAELVNEIE